ncbi:hypothetical protein [Streptomyces thermoalcalitolerans]|uniref:Uncharacterized protein n=1 Tax=Streptomyces thermoalcalitolerans TaxID=65605 RepID=A0ABP4A5R2_9ACTN
MTGDPSGEAPLTRLAQLIRQPPAARERTVYAAAVAAPVGEEARAT